MTLMMEEPTAGAGKVAKPTGMASVLAPRVRVNTLALGTMDLKWWGYTRGPVAIPMRVTGLKESAMA